jgi:hydrogenase maturation protein HypF
MLDAVKIHVKGVVQGVGFRPFVYREAKKNLIAGWVLNAADGVHIHAQGESNHVDAFILALSNEAPAAARVEEIDIKEVPLEDFTSFEIRFSEDEAGTEKTLVSPDLATCADCARELFDPANRRFRYPFINCTNCGPRFTIIERLPYDRAATSMKDFPMCVACEAEYANPLDRRFHAQPNACFECGPVVSLTQGTGAGAELAEGATSEGGAGEAELSTTLVGSSREESDAIFAEAVHLLLAGKILAVKGLGGYHLVCDANNAQAVAELRTRKRRDGKALAVMAQTTEDARALCFVHEEEQAVLESTPHPIVLLRKRPDAALAAGVADGLNELGVMLPYTPVQLLLMHDFAEAWRAQQGAGSELGQAVPLLVMTSGNVHDEPICISAEEAHEKLSGIADAFLDNNRAILTRFDDSVVRLIKVPSAQETQGAAGAAAKEGISSEIEETSATPSATEAATSSSETEAAAAFSAHEAAATSSTDEAADYAIQFIRRARGYAPLPLSVATPEAAASEAPAEPASVASAEAAAPESTTPLIFATGPEQKNTFTFLRGSEAFVSQHMGDVENAETYDAWLAAQARFKELFDFAPQRIACDKHPEYLTSKWAHEQGKLVCEVQHHHAHIVSVMAENNLADAVCGIAFDGTGYGEDGAIWGGEVLISNRQAFERFANFTYVPMPGGAAAIKNPLRMAYGVLWAYDLLDHPAAHAALAELGAQAEVCNTMIEQEINTPQTSSVGRLFDAASALLGVCTQPTYEGEAAILFEAAMENAGADAPHAAVSEEAAGVTPESELAAKERYAITVVKNTATEASTAQDTSVVLLDVEATFRALLDDVADGVPVSIIARRFHDAFVSAIVMAAELVRAVYGISTVVLSGGVFMNRYLIEHALEALTSAGFTTALNRDLPPNDGNISVGQAVVALND